ncbi:MAG: hypothetical protein JO244_03185 [Solirubrobacterales bacterium]|nr:hypothetical protein [Solirubrobacterales bacterium]
MESIEDFIAGLPHQSEETRSALWLLAWTDTDRRESRRLRVAELLQGERQLAGRVNADGRRDWSEGQTGWLTGMD